MDKDVIAHDGLELFKSFFEEGLAFAKVNADFSFEIADLFPPAFKLSKEVLHFPLNQVGVDFINRRITVDCRWLIDCIEQLRPSAIRHIAYIHSYRYYFFVTDNNDKESTVKDDALIFSSALFAINGIPMPNYPEESRQNVLAMLHKFTGKKHDFVRTWSYDSDNSIGCSLSPMHRRRKAEELDRIRRAQNRVTCFKRDAILGSKENPFENVDDALSYIKKLEQEVVAEDPFINSEFVKTRYPFDLFAYRDFKKRKNYIAGIYKIPWASAYTAHMQNNWPDHSFIVTQLNPGPNDWSWLLTKAQEQMPLFSLKPNLYRRRFLLRGQTEEYHIDVNGQRVPTCCPNAYRKNVKDNALPHMIKTAEMCCLVTRHPLVQLLGINGVRLFNEPFRFQLSVEGLAQHYYNKTTLLDLTSDYEGAKFFATLNYRFADDKCYAVEDGLGVIYVYDLKMPDAFSTQGPKGTSLSSIGKQYVFGRSAQQSGFLLKMPDGVHLHNLPNVHRFYFHQNSGISKEMERKTNFGELYYPDDCLSQLWSPIRDIKNSEFTVSRMAVDLCLKFNLTDIKSRAELVSRLCDEGFRIGDNEWPQFPREILEEYYKEVKNGLWQEFTKDIYFHGAEGYFMKKALSDLPLNDDYRRFFEQQ